MLIKILKEVDSTNSYLMREASSLDAPLMVIARSQTAGRGQRGNSWESEPGKNLTFSVLYRPESFPAVSQFSISEATAFAVVDFLALHGIEAKVKWANDIYVGDKKICGILIQHSLMGPKIGHSVLGIGINVNQTEFLSDAPNPISMKQITGKTYDLDELANQIAACIESRLEKIYSEADRDALHVEFKENLWRGDGKLYPFTDTATGERFEASISDIDPHGPMTLRLSDASIRTYSFKEVAFLIMNDKL